MSFFPALDEITLRQQLGSASSSLLQRLSLLDQTDSTNAVLLQMAETERHAHAVLADHQTAGRGRRGRRWQSPPGSNIYLSLGWSFEAVPADLSCLPLAIGVAAVRGLEQTGVSGLGLKWPNDILAGGKKLGGILLESKFADQSTVSAVVGIGINVRMPAESDSAPLIDQAWTSVCDLAPTAKDPSLRDRVAGAVLDQLLLCLNTFTEYGFVPFREDWVKLDVLKNQPVTINLAGKEFHGQALGIDQQGNLQVAEHIGSDKQKLHAFSAGEVSVRQSGCRQNT